MTRVFTGTFEADFATEGWTTSGTPERVTSPVADGTYACLVNAVNEYVYWAAGASVSELSWYVRALVRVAAYPSAGNYARIISHHSAGGTELWRLTLKSDGTLQARTATPADIGSPSSALSLDAWYVVETRTLRRASGNDEVEARVYLNGDTPAASFVNDTGTDRGWGVGVGRILFGSLDAASTIVFDDTAINDANGTSNNSWPGPILYNLATSDTVAVADSAPTVQLPAAGQTLLPDADLAAGGWVVEPLYSKINDGSDATLVTGTLA